MQRRFAKDGPVWKGTSNAQLKKIVSQFEFVESKGIL